MHISKLYYYKLHHLIGAQYLVYILFILLLINQLNTIYKT